MVFNQMMTLKVRNCLNITTIYQDSGYTAVQYSACAPILGGEGRNRGNRSIRMWQSCPAGPAAATADAAAVGARHTAAVAVRSVVVEAGRLAGAVVVADSAAAAGGGYSVAVGTAADCTDPLWQ